LKISDFRKDKSMTLIDRQAPSHWYLRDGRPFHEVPKKDGTGNRAVTLADARKVMAFPSVTNVLGVIAKPGLDAWKIEQGIVSALTLPRSADESLDVFAKRVVADMGEQVEKAADFGTAIHAACELYAREKIAPTDEKLAQFFADWQQWFDGNVERVECLEDVFVNTDWGFAGRVDMIAKLAGIGWAVVDFKTQKIKRTPKGEPRPAFYESWPMQLAAYRNMAVRKLAKPIDALVSVVIDSAKPGPVHVKVYENADAHFEMFQAALALWKYVKCYNPVALTGFN
jgi:hypothetical protein